MELETHYSLRCLLNAQSGLRIHSCRGLQSFAADWIKCFGKKGWKQPAPFTIPSCAEKKKLCSLLNGSRLSLLEIGQEELASASQKLVCSVRHFPIMAPGLYADADWRFKVCRPASNQR